MHSVRLGDCVEVMRSMLDASVDAVVSDPPYELGFMGKRWDASGIAYSVEMWREVLRVLRPGGHLLAFGGARTCHRMACAIEDAGFEIRDGLDWVYGSGFPKSLDVSKALDGHLDVTVSGSWAARQWEGWGTALKPAREPIVLARKPLDGTVAENVLKHGTAGINVEACRVGWAGAADMEMGRPASFARARESFAAGGPGSGTFAVRDRSAEDPVAAQSAAGRWPPNLLLTHAPECNGTCAPGCPVALLDEQSGELTSGVMRAGTERSERSVCYGAMPATATLQDTYGDTGGASRFFPVFRWEPDDFPPFLYVPKPARAERDVGLHDLPASSAGEATDREDGSDGLKSPRAGAGRTGGARNIHPTVKPVALMEWLVRLVTPPGGTVLDPFLGSGTTGAAAVRLGFDFIGIEREPAYVEIARRRIELAANAPRSKPLGALERVEADPRQPSLFGSIP